MFTTTARLVNGAQLGSLKLVLRYAMPHANPRTRLEGRRGGGGRDTRSMKSLQKIPTTREDANRKAGRADLE